MAEPVRREEDILQQYTEYGFRLGCRFRELRAILPEIPVSSREGLSRFATDGRTVFAGSRPRWEDYLHTMIHLLCGHPAGAADRWPAVWDLACDMAAEYIRTLMFPDSGGERLRREVRGLLTEGGDPCRAEDLYPSLMNLHEEELEEMAWNFRRDEHFLWRTGADKTSGQKTAPGEAGDLTGEGKLPGMGGDSPADRGEPPEEDFRERTLKLWLPLLQSLNSGEQESRRWGLTPGTLEERALVRERNRLDFTRYLGRFSVFGEEMMPDEGSFDQIPYCFGLQLYGDLPMIEPLEYADCYRVEDLVIALDTSGSCSLELVQEFLGEIRHILMDHDAFFRRMNVHILQCDAVVREHRVIRCREEWDRYAREVQILGRRGTDFRPVFSFVEELRREKAFRRLKGLFYFTDGEGVYPEKAPDYQVAFVYSTAKPLQFGIPEWVTPLCLHLEEEMI